MVYQTESPVNKYNYNKPLPPLPASYGSAANWSAVEKLRSDQVRSSNIRADNLKKIEPLYYAAKLRDDQVRWDKLFGSGAGVTFQGGLVQAHVSRLSDDASRCGGGRRGVISGFSPASRLRLMRLFASLDQSRISSVFLTLTYPAEFPSPAEAKKHLRTFLKRVSRLYPGASGVWRLEFQERGAPHFHLVLFNLPFMPKELVQSWWGDIIGFDAPFTRIEFISTRKKLVNYVSKYTAKVGGRRGFNIDAYLTAEGKFIHPQTGEVSNSVGRHWGIFNGELLPYADSLEVSIPLQQMHIFYAFRRGVRKVWRKAGRTGKNAGFTLFVSSADKWHKYILAVSVGDA